MVVLVAAAAAVVGGAGDVVGGVITLPRNIVDGPGTPKGTKCL